METSNDGFYIAEEDLRLRGPGEIFGTRQHGLPDMCIADLSKHLKILEQAKAELHGGRNRNSRRRDNPPRGSEAPRAPQAEGQPCRHRLYLRVNGLEDPKLEQVKPMLNENRGDLPVILCDAASRKRWMAPRNLWTYNNLLLFDKIKFILGEENVIIK